MYSHLIILAKSRGFSSFIQTMPQGKAVSPDIQWIVIRLAADMSPGDISMYTGLSIGTVWKILRFFAEFGNINVPQRMRPAIYKTLCDNDIAVCIYGFQSSNLSWRYVPTAPTKNLEWHTWYLPWRNACRLDGNMQCSHIKVDDLENTHQRGLYDEEGIFTTYLFYVHY